MDLDNYEESHTPEYAYDSDTEAQPQNNLEELQYLLDEAQHMILHGIVPTEGWYDDHFRYVYKYSKVDWNDIIKRFRDKDNIMYELAANIKYTIETLMESYSGKPDFDFNDYYVVLQNIFNIWRYYSNKYMGDETDSDVLDIIEGMTFL